MTVIAGRYTLETEVGRGGMGAVWRGRDDVLGRTVALKRIGIGPGGITPDALRAEREAKLAAKLNHANVVAVFDLVAETTHDGESQQWLVMEYVEGTDLAELIRTRGRLGPDEAARILAQVAGALAAAHRAGIVHRDVKPSNILVAPDGQVKLNDFGIARTATDPALTQTGLVTGSPAYLSPEVATGQHATPASDVWSWGATLFHTLEGRPPYQVDNVLGVLYRIVHEEPPRSGSAGWLAPVLASTMTRDPGQRWPMDRVHEFLQGGGMDTQPAVAAAGGLADLGFGGSARTRSHDDASRTQVLPPATTAPPPPPSPAERVEGAPPRRPWPIVVGAALVVVVAMVIAFAIGLHDGGGDNERSGGPGPSSPAGDSSGGPSQSASGSADAPTEEGMTSFVEDYIDTAVGDPRSAFAMLTPEYQQASHGFRGYDGFWGDVRSAKILSISADPETLRVSYTYRYVRPGGPTTEDVTLQLVFQDGTYLIAGTA